MWQYRGQKRPPFAVKPKSGQESVWDYPRPPKLVSDERQVNVCDENQIIATSIRTYRVLETASPPTFYIPPQDVNWDLLKSSSKASVCEWKGVARYWELFSKPQIGAVAWSYAEPKPAYAQIRDYVAFYPTALICTVASERVSTQPGLFYAGWITAEIVGPFKGEPGTSHW